MDVHEKTPEAITVEGSNEHKEERSAEETEEVIGEVASQDSSRNGDLEGQHLGDGTETKDFSADWRFWIIFVALAFTSLLTAIEATVTSTALPTIAQVLNAQEVYVWFVNSFFLTCTIVQPLYGQFANIFGRRWPILFAISTFALGSGLCGGAKSSAMLIAGRAIQGLGLGGVNVMIDCVVCDLVPLRNRPNFMALIYVVFSIGTSVGPFVGGVFVDRVSWRWAFYFGLPFCGVSLFLMLLFLQVEYKKETTFKHKMKRIDWVGNFLLSCSVIAILCALTYGGTTQPWSSWRVLLPFVIGIVGYIAFHIFEASKFCFEPTIPPRLFSNRTSFAAFIVTFLHGMLTYWVVYFLPVYFQGVLRSSPTRSGVQLLPTAIVLFPFAIIAGLYTTKTGRYKPPQILGWVFMNIGLGLLSLLDESSPAAAWAGYQIIIAIGSGLIITPSLPAAQAELPESDVASSAATWSFMRTFGGIWGVSIPAAVFNNKFDTLVHKISDTATRSRLTSGAAYQHASGEFITSFPVELQSAVTDTYVGSLKMVWQVSIAFAILGFMISLIEKEVKLRETLETDYTLKERKDAKNKDSKAG
ncbi:major facilitator superfamily domain-containing protein [Tricladium varicosporioides]|nr:major facilitator superfamily domain-containing protein [Hymenoscyphus varicosporioides]